MKDYKIRRLEPADTESWLNLRIESLVDSPSAFMASPETELSEGIETCRERIANGGDKNVIFGCFFGTEIVATVGLYQESALKAKHKGTIWGMYVKPEFRGKKVGRELLQMAIEHATDKLKLTKIDLSVEASREAAKRLYSSLGFKTWGFEKSAICVDGKFFDEEYMSLFLSEFGKTPRIN